VVDSWQNIAGSDGFQCLTPGTQNVVGGDDYDGFVSRINGFYSMLSAYGKPIAPCAAANIDEPPREQFGNPDPSLWRYYANFTPYKFYQGLQNVALWQQAHHNSVSNVLSIYAWNEWQEGGIIEPNVRDGRLFLDLIQRAFRTINLNRYTGTAGHRVTTQALGSPWQLEAVWKIFNEQDTTNSRVALYECQRSAGYFVSRDPSCEGSTSLGLLGYLAAGQYDLQGLVPIYRCLYNGTDRFVSDASDCQKSQAPTLNLQTEMLLGYAFPY
jgi:hypothetical protein